MDCSTCINRFTPYKKGLCRTMTSPFSDYSCHRTKAQAMAIEYKLMASGDHGTIEDAKQNIMWLKGLEG